MAWTRWKQCRRIGTWFSASMIMLAAVALPARGAPSLPWMPSAAVRSDIELLVDDAGLDLTVMQWPLPRLAVKQAIDRLPPGLQPRLDAARERVLQALADELGSQGTLTVQDRDDALAGYGDDATRGSSAAARSPTFEAAHLAARAGVRVDSLSGPDEHAKLHFDDSGVASEAFGLQAQAFSHRYWWGPGWQSSLMLSNNAPAFAGVGIQRASASRSSSPWLSWLGPWNLEAFIARTEDVTLPAHPLFVGQRLSFKPFDNLELALTRTAQWGGRGREDSFKSFVHMLTGQGVNADTSQQRNMDPANEMAGFDFRLRCPSGLRCAGYMQLIGEDQAGVLPSRYLGLYGMEYWTADGRQRFYAEYAETGCRSPIGQPFLHGCAYRNYAYPQGYTSGGRWIGASAGPDSRILTLGWLNAAVGSSVRVEAGRIGSRLGTFTALDADPTSSGQLFGVSTRQSFAWGAAVVTPEFAWTRVAALDGSHNQLRVGATLTMGLDRAR